MQFTFPLHCFFDVPSLVDLQKGDEPNIYSRVWKVGPGQLFKGQSELGYLYPSSNTNPHDTTDLATVIVNLCKSSLRDTGQIS